MRKAEPYEARAVSEMDQKSRLLYAVNGAAEILLTTDDAGFERSLREGMALMARCMEVDRIYIWQNKMKDGRLSYIQQFEWLGDAQPEGMTVRTNTGFTYVESMPEWEAKFQRGECVNGPLSSLSRTEQERLGPYGVKSLLVIPVHLQDRFWGFVSFDDCHRERTFSDDEVNILRSANLMIVSAVDRHDAAARMREADEYAKLMLDATPLCCCLWDSSFHLINCNEEVVSFFGLKDKQEYLDRFFELSPEYQPDGSLSRQKAMEYITAAFREGGRNVIEWTHLMPDGEIVPTEVTIVRVRRGDEYIVAGYTRDLREHKKMMKEIEYKDNLLHTVNDMAGILLRSDVDDFESELFRCMGMMADSACADRMYIWKNHEKDGRLTSTQLYEWSRGAQPQQGSEYVVDIPYSEIAPSWSERLLAGQCINGRVRDQAPTERAHLTAQGALSVLVVPVFLRDQFWGFVGFDDCHGERVFSEEEVSILRSGSLLIAHALLRYEMAHEIQEAVQQAQAASKSKSVFLAHMSHEIRTPMNVISGMTELILREELPASIYEYIMSVKHASANMLSLINDILDFSKIEAGGLELAPTEYLLTSLINDVLIIIRMKVSERPILFTANIDCDIPNQLIGDETRVRQILLNVLDNAVKYTQEGFVSLTITGEIDGDTVVLTAEVSDSGIGIKEGDVQKLFDDFTRFGEDKYRSVQGTGLGLPITKSLTEAMGGNISVRSEYGVGSTFTMTIPQRIKSRDRKFAKVEDPGSKRVLLYETRRVCAESIARSLANLGVGCTRVDDRQAFCEALRQRSHPFVFMSSLLYEGVAQMIEGAMPDITLVLLTEFGEVPAIHNIRTIAIPVHAATIANILDDVADNTAYIGSGPKNTRFIAPSAQILVVDDMNTNLRVAQGLMLPYQMQIDICGSGEEAIECAAKKRYDMIFMDHMMPGMDGIEATGRIRSLEDGSGYYERVPIIALTANAVSGVKEMFLQNGMNDFLAKPIDLNKLHGLLNKCIPEEKKDKRGSARPETTPFDIGPAQIQIGGVDIQAGIALSGGTVGSYLKTLTIFHVDASDKIGKLRDCVEKNDIKLYTVYVHALKSAAASIGALEMSDRFRQLEMAGARGDIAFIREHTDRCLRELAALLKNAAAVIPKNRTERAREYDPQLLKNELMKLKGALNNVDAGEVNEIIAALETVSWSHQTDELFAEIHRSIFLIDYANAAVLVDELYRLIDEADEGKLI